MDKEDKIICATWVTVSVITFLYIMIVYSQPTNRPPIDYIALLSALVGFAVGIVALGVYRIVIGLQETLLYLKIRRIGKNVS